MFTGRGKAGHTLIELMVASVVMLLMMGLVYEMFIAGKRYQDNCQAKMELQDDVMKSLAKSSQDMVESDRLAIVPTSTSNAVCFSTPRSVEGRVSFDSSGRLLWKKYVCYYVADSPNGVPTLYRKVKEISPSVTDVPPPPSLATLRDDPSLPARIIAPNITAFNVTAVSDGTFNVLVRGELRLLARTYGVEVQGSTLPSN